MKKIYDAFLNEKQIIEKLQQQINEKPTESTSVPPTNVSSTEVEQNSNQTLDILQELLNTIKQNNQLEVSLTWTHFHD